jgi:hypothetical protein
MAFDRVPEEFEALPIIVADVSGAREPEPRSEVHRLSPLVQDGSRVLPDGSSTQGLRQTACGIPQATRGHGFFFLENAYQLGRIERGDWPLCPYCLPLGLPAYLAERIREQKP